MAFDTSQPFSNDVAKLINVGRGNVGSTPSGPALFTDNFESGIIGNQPNASSSAFSWDGGAYNTVSEDQSFSGSKSLKLSFIGNVDLTEDAWGEQRFALDRKYTELWIRYRLYVPVNYVHRSPSLSFHFQLPVGTTNPGGSRLYPAWRPNAGTVWNIYDVTDFSRDWVPEQNQIDGITAADRGTWIDWVIHVKCSTIEIPQGSTPWENNGTPITGNGVCEIWKNDQKVMNVQNATNFYNGGASDPGGVGDGWNYGYLLGWANSGFDEDTFMHIDEFSIAETAAGVGFTPI